VVGMVIVETIGQVRRVHFVKGKTIKEIARDLKISRNTVRKILRSEETSFSYDCEVQPRPKLENCSAELDRLLTTNAANSARERLTSKIAKHTRFCRDPTRSAVTRV
jgi:predicted transcriptional regulator